MPRTKQQAEKEAPPYARSMIMSPKQVATQFVKGQSGNRNLFGMSNMDAAQGRINAKTALRLRAMILETLESKIATQYDIILNPEATAEERLEAQTAILKHLNADTNTLLRDAETRGLGAPKQEISLSREDKRLEDMTDEELEDLIVDAEYTMVEGSDGQQG